MSLCAQARRMGCTSANLARALSVSWILWHCLEAAPSDLNSTSPGGPTTVVQSISMTVSGPRLRAPENDLKDKAVYGLPLVLQVSPTEAAVVLNLRLRGLAVIDYEAGSDVVIFDSLDKIAADRAIPFERNEKVADPETGEDLVKVKYPPSLGFVPSGARLPDGRPHPHAGTGFALGSVVYFPSDTGKARDFAKRRGGVSPLMQIRHNGRRLEIVSQAPVGPDVLPEGWSLCGNGMSVAIPGGEDLLAAASMRDGPGYGCAGMCRWRRVDGTWRMIGFVPVTPKDGAREASLVRDADGTLVFSARGAADPPVDDPESRFALRVWRSTDDGRTWTLACRVDRGRPCSPVTMNRTLAGWPFLAADPRPGRRTPEQEKRIEESTIRERLWLWPLSADRCGLASPVSVMDALSRYGPGTDGLPWYIDHANSTIVRLADGRLHCLIGFRVCGAAEVLSDAKPAPQSGAWIEEVTQHPPGRPVPVWRF